MAELDKKTEIMLKLIEEDADSFAQRAEMYYKKRPELISLVEDFYRSHRSLVERCDRVKSDPGTRIVATLGSSFSSMKSSSEKTTNATDKGYDSYSETFDSEDYAESEVDNPELEEEEIEDLKLEDTYKTYLVTKVVVAEKKDGPLLEQGVTEEISKVDNKIATSILTNPVRLTVYNDEVMKLREEVERLKEENKVQKAQSTKKDEEKREVIRQLSLAVQVLKDENMELKKRIFPRKQSSRIQHIKGDVIQCIYEVSCYCCCSVVLDGVILGVDTRATEEPIVCDKNCEKIHYLHLTFTVVELELLLIQRQ
ncbi:hypothetical protein PTKIN_Ptkin15bG0149900 [Pterospermum kingtungense]